MVLNALFLIGQFEPIINETDHSFPLEFQLTLKKQSRENKCKTISIKYRFQHF